MAFAGLPGFAPNSDPVEAVLGSGIGYPRLCFPLRKNLRLITHFVPGLIRVFQFSFGIDDGAVAFTKGLMLELSPTKIPHE